MDTYMDTKLCMVLNSLMNTRVRLLPGAPASPTDYTNLLFYKSDNYANFTSLIFKKRHI